MTTEWDELVDEVLAKMESEREPERPRRLTVVASDTALRSWRVAAAKADLSLAEWTRRTLNQAALKPEAKRR